MNYIKEIAKFYWELLLQLVRKLRWPTFKRQGTTNLNLSEWSSRRIVSLAISSGIYLVLLAATLYSSIDFWGGHAKTRSVGIGFALLLDGLAMLCLIFRITRIQFPLNFLRHTLPLTTVIPVYLFGLDQLGDMWLAGFATVLILAFSFILQRHIEGLFISPKDLAEEAIRAHAAGLLNEHLRRQAVDGVLIGFREESVQISEATPSLQLAPATGREQFRIQYRVAHKHVTEAYQRYRRGENFDQFKNTSK